MAQPQEALPHKISLSERKNLNVLGVTEVVGFDDASVVLNTSMGTLIVQGKELQLKALSDGQVTVSGTVSALLYEEPRPAGGLLRRMFR